MQSLCLKYLLEVTELSMWVLDTGFVNVFLEDGLIESICVINEYNVADIFTKKTSGGIGNIHHNKMVKEIETKQEGVRKCLI